MQSSFPLPPPPHLAPASFVGELERLRTSNSRLEIEVHGMRVDKEMVELKVTSRLVNLTQVNHTWVASVRF